VTPATDPGVSAAPDPRGGPPRPDPDDQLAQAVADHDDALAALESGRLDDARQFAARAVEGLIRTLGDDAPDVANALLTSASVEEAFGRFDLAHDRVARAAAIAEPLAETTDLELLGLWCDVQVRLASVRCTLGDFDAAEAGLRGALDVVADVLPPADPHVVAIHNQRGIAAKYSGRFDDAAASYQQVLDAWTAAGNPEPNEMAGLLHNLGGLEHARGRPAEGLEHARRGLALRRRTLGDDDPAVASDLNAIGALYRDAADAAEAERCYMEALTIFEAAYGPDHYEVGMTCANLAVAMADAGDVVVARGLYERALRILVAALGADHPDVALVQHNFAVLLADCGDVALARTMLERAERTLVAAVGPDHPRTIDVRATVAGLASDR
jgi:tetratricopeptide (TPR) repeat protein